LAPPEVAMTRYFRTAGLVLPAALLLSMPGSVQSQQRSNPKPVALCLPPGGKPSPCGTANAGQTIRVQLATTSLPTGPIQLRFAEEPVAGRTPRTAMVTVPPARSIDGGYEVKVPSELCTGARGSEGQFEIQMMTSDLQNSETGAAGHADSIGWFQMRC
jgi:hypothetical protein